jgi:hypothetical protein
MVAHVGLWFGDNLMTRIFFGALAIASSFATGAMAADLPVKAPPMPVAIFNWTGFYIGGNVGGSWGREHDDGSVTGTQSVQVFRTAGPTPVGGPVGSRQVWRRFGDGDGGDEPAEYTCAEFQHRDDDDAHIGVQHPLHRQHRAGGCKLQMGRPGGCEILTRNAISESKARPRAGPLSCSGAFAPGKIGIPLALIGLALVLGSKAEDIFRLSSR